ncbi:thioesterase family protein [Streptomyces sp. NPDC048441]|uniref:thioesterase family protein n=1 Tax=Streptomyces sp. NPDC048441 TaxID=3365552 RepID=UPI003721FC6F
MRYEVTDADTAVSVGSGDVPVLTAPRLIAWLEAATLQASAPFISGGQTTVGTAIRVQYLRPSRRGDRVDVTAEPPASSVGKRLTFLVKAIDGSGELVATGEIDRAIVDRNQFLAMALASQRAEQ